MPTFSQGQNQVQVQRDINYIFVLLASRRPLGDSDCWNAVNQFGANFDGTEIVFKLDFVLTWRHRQLRTIPRLSIRIAVATDLVFVVFLDVVRT